MLSQEAIWSRILAATPGAERDAAVLAAFGVNLQQALTQLTYARDVATAGTVDAAVLTDIRELEGLLRGVLDGVLTPDPALLRDWEQCSCGGRVVTDDPHDGTIPLTETCQDCGRIYESIPF